MSSKLVDNSLPSLDVVDDVEMTCDDALISVDNVVVVVDDGDPHDDSVEVSNVEDEDVSSSIFPVDVEI